MWRGLSTFRWPQYRGLPPPDSAIFVSQAARGAKKLFARDAQPAPKAIDKLHRSHQSLLFGEIMGTPQPVIGLPMHAFRPGRKRLQRIRASSQLYSNFLCLPKSAPARGFLLACIGEAVAAATREQFASEVQQRHAAPAVLLTSIGRTDKPRAAATKMAGCPRDRHPLFHQLPLGVAPALMSKG